MFTSINKQVTSKFRSTSTQQNRFQKSTNTKLSRTVSQVPNQLHSLRRGDKVKNVAKTVAAAPSVSTPQVSKNTPKKLSVEEQKRVSRPNNKEVVAKEKPPIGKKQEQKTAGVTPRSRTTAKIVAFGSTLASPVAVSNYPRYISNSNDSDFKVTNSAYKNTMSGIFCYDLSPMERNGYGVYQEKPVKPMKLVPPTEEQLLKDGQRSTYLERRYERKPDDKYNYPEATSMRYGWFHRLGDPSEGRQARRD